MPRRKPIRPEQRADFMRLEQDRRYHYARTFYPEQVKLYEQRVNEQLVQARRITS